MKPVLLVLLLLAGCVTAPDSPTAPETFEGEMPCADCAAQRVTVALYPDGTYRLRRTYVGFETDREPARFHELGRWQESGVGESRVLELGSGTNLQRFRRGPDALRLLDREGREIESRLDYTLLRTSDVEPVTGPFRLTGLHTYMADSHTFADCATGLRYPVLPGQARLALERGYREAQTAPGVPALATLEGRFVLVAPEPDLAPREHLLVERVFGFKAQQVCP